MKNNVPILKNTIESGSFDTHSGSNDKDISDLENREYKGLGVAISLGELPSKYLSKVFCSLSSCYYKELREAGANRYLLRKESSNPDLYAKLDQSSS